MCGIVGVSDSQQAAEEIFLGLQNLQHRGQDGGGIVTLENGQLHCQKGTGLLEIAFPPEQFHTLKGVMGIGHTRYATVGKQDRMLLQPFISDKARLAIAHNGNLVNYHKMHTDIQTQDAGALGSGCDSEVILWYLEQHLLTQERTPESLKAGVKQLSENVVGSYSVIGIADNIGLFAFRDPYGLRPLVMGQRQETDGKTVYAFASESMALEFVGYTHIEDVKAGELVVVTPEGGVFRELYAEPKPQHCMFEWVYFARVESHIESLDVYQARFNLGVALGKAILAQGYKPDIVVPVPETSRIAAIAIAEVLGVPFREVLIKNRYVNRTFILDSQAARLEAIKRKLYPVASQLEGRKVLIVDDSIVRGNTAIRIIDAIRKSGAEAIYMASTCPPIKYPCYYGIDFPSKTELLAGQHTEEELRSILKVDGLIYQTLDGLKTALNHLPLCNACLTGEYPTDVTEGLRFSEQRAKEREVTIQ